MFVEKISASPSAKSVTSTSSASASTNRVVFSPPTNTVIVSTSLPSSSASVPDSTNTASSDVESIPPIPSVRSTNLYELSEVDLL